MHPSSLGTNLRLPYINLYKFCLTVISVIFKCSMLVFKKDKLKMEWNVADIIE